MAEWWRQFYRQLYELLGNDVSDSRMTVEELQWLVQATRLSPGDLLLDVGCGWGRHVLGLGEGGLRVVGLDVDPHLIAAAESMSREAGLDQTQFVVADMRDLPSTSDLVPGPFAAALMMDSVSGIFGREQTRDILSAVYNRLRPGGSLVLSQVSIDWCRDGHVWMRPLERGRLLQRRIHYHEQQQVLSDEVAITVQETGEIKKLPQQRLFLYEPHALVDLVREAGFEQAVLDPGPELADDVQRSEIYVVARRAAA
jgi:D-alanine-D-alanine ligase